MAVGETKSGKVLCTGWTGALISPPAKNGRKIRIEGGVAPGVVRSYHTPMTDRFRWERLLEFGDQSISVTVSLTSPEPISRVEELLPVAFFANTVVTAT